MADLSGNYVVVPADGSSVADTKDERKELNLLLLLRTKSEDSYISFQAYCLRNQARVSHISELNGDVLEFYDYPESSRVSNAVRESYESGCRILFFLAQPNIARGS